MEYSLRLKWKIYKKTKLREKNEMEKKKNL